MKKYKCVIDVEIEEYQHITEGGIVEAISIYNSSSAIVIQLEGASFPCEISLSAFMVGFEAMPDEERL